MSALGAARPASTLMSTGYELRLYHGSEPDITIGTRQLGQGSMTLGRDPESDWVVNDPDRTLSRRHCELVIRAEGLAICVSGVNGAYAHNEKLPLGVESLLAVPCMLTLGDFRLAVRKTNIVHSDVDSSVEPLHLPIASLPPRETTSFAIPASTTAADNRSLLEAFCEGAGLDSSLLVCEEPDEIMRRAGAIYRHTVLGVGDLMADRDRARSRYDLQHTKIGGTGNNLFKWASTRRLAVDLLLTGPAGFLSGPDAVQSSFRAIKRHIAASQEGMQGCFRALVDMFSPNEIDCATSDGSSQESRATAQMEEVARRHTEIVKQLDNAETLLLDDAFALAYEAAEFTSRGLDR